MGSPTQKTVYDGFAAMDLGMNSGLSPTILPKNQCSLIVNATARGGFLTTRPSVRRIALDYGTNAVLETRATTGRFQGACYFDPQQGDQALVASINGRLFSFVPDNDKSAVVGEVTINGGTFTTNLFTVPAVGASQPIVVQSTANIEPTYEIEIAGFNFTVESVIDGQNMTVVNVDAIEGDILAVGTSVIYWDVNPSLRQQAWLFQAEDWVIVNDGQSTPIFYDGATSRRSNINGNPQELPAGRMGVYGLGRVWMSGTDGRTFFAGDLVGGPAGTPTLQRRDSVLKFTENTYLNGGGRFIVPGNVGDIQAMRFAATLDASLGQGPLQVFTPKVVFSCSAPVDRSEWQTVENPILTQSLIGNGGLSQNATISVNGDIIFRSPEGLRSLVLGRREFATWGNTPISREMNFIFNSDDPELLAFSSAILFDNRFIITSTPVYSNAGVYHRGMVALDFDIISSMRGKAPSVYDGSWVGMDILQMVVGEFGGRERAFAFVLESTETPDVPSIGLYEILAQNESYYDNEDTRIFWAFETGDIRFEEKGLGPFDKKTLVDGELYVDDIIGRVDFSVYVRPDQSPCWVKWKDWFICREDRRCPPDALTGCYPLKDLKPGYYPRMGFGIPPNSCVTEQDQPANLGYSFQLRVEVTGHCRIMGCRLAIVPADTNAFAPPICSEDCNA
jgi:hypothetical protein